MTPSDKVKDIMRQVSINKRGREDSTYVTLESKVLKLSDNVKGCGGQDGSTLHVNHRVRVGGSKKTSKQSKKTEKLQKNKRDKCL